MRVRAGREGGRPLLLLHALPLAPRIADLASSFVCTWLRFVGWLRWASRVQAVPSSSGASTATSPSRAPLATTSTSTGERARQGEGGTGDGAHCRACPRDRHRRQRMRCLSLLLLLPLPPRPCRRDLPAEAQQVSAEPELRVQPRSAGDQVSCHRHRSHGCSRHDGAVATTTRALRRVHTHLRLPPTHTVSCLIWLISCLPAVITCRSSSCWRATASGT